MARPPGHRFAEPGYDSVPYHLVGRQNSKDARKPSLRWNENRVVEASIGADLRSGCGNLKPINPLYDEIRGGLTGSATIKGNVTASAISSPNPGELGRTNHGHAAPVPKPGLSQLDLRQYKLKRFQASKLRFALITWHTLGVWAPGLHG